jgi:thiol-disulfide isomerase/thioredoxin
MDSEKTLEMYALLSDKVKNGKMKPILDAAIARINEEMERKEQAKNIDEGKPAPDFTLNDINGKPLSLSSLRGKYVIIDFWGSWCGWCIKGMPKMKEYYAKYADKLEILGVDCGDSDESWKNAVKQHELPWKHVYHTDDSNVTTLYAIEGFPTKIVVDPQGNIAKVIVGEDPAFYEYLDELFK